MRARAPGAARAACAERGPQGRFPLRASLRFGVVPCVAGALRLCGAKRPASPKGPRRIAWDVVGAPLRPWARSMADGPASSP